MLAGELSDEKHNYHIHLESKIESTIESPYRTTVTSTSNDIASNLYWLD
jgi:hypothetical protein